MPQRIPSGSISLARAITLFVGFNLVVATVALAFAQAHLIPKGMFDSRGTEFEAMREDRFIP